MAPKVTSPYSGFNECIGKLTEYMGGKLSDKQAEELIRTLEKRLQQRAGTNSAFAPRQIVEQEAKKLALDTLHVAAVEKRNALLNLQAKQGRAAKMNALMAEGAHVGEALQSLMVGTNTGRTGNRLSVAARQHAAEQQVMGGLLYDLEKAGVRELVASGDLDLPIARELWELSNPKGGKPGISGNTHARKAAEVIHKWQRASVEGLNAVGADIRHLEGYITRQTHSRWRMRKEGKDAWIQAIAPHLDVERTFQGADPAEFLSKAYDTLVTGLAQKAAPEADTGIPLKGFGNVAKRHSQHRTLHFKSAEDWWAYHQKFGDGNLIENVTRSLQKGARDTELMRVFGTNPQAAFEADVDRLRQQNRDKDAFQYLDGGYLQRRRWEMAEITGDANISQAHTGWLNSGIHSGIRALINMAALGGTVISSFTDVVGIAAAARHNGVGLLGGYARGFKSLVEGRGTKESREIAQLVGVGFDGVLGHIVGRFGANDTLPGTLSKMQQAFFRLNLLAWWTDAQKAGVGRMLSHHLATYAESPFTALPEDLQRTLRGYEIGEAQWDTIRQTPTRHADGNAYITPDGIEDAETALRLRAYFTDQVDFAVLTPGARERALMRMGTQPGTVQGEALRYIGQFKSFPVAMLTKVWGREAFASGKGDILGMVHLATMLTVFGYLAMTAKDYAKGLEPREPDDPKTWAAAMTQGGGLGIMGDFLFADYNRFGGGLWSSALGPAAGKLEDVAKIFSAAVRGDDAAAKAVNTLINSAPGNNLFYVRTALNYAFLYQVQEMLNPGYLRRMERRRKREEGREFIIPPSKAA